MARLKIIFIVRCARTGNDSYRENTKQFGTNLSPYLSVKGMIQKNYPKRAKLLNSDFPPTKKVTIRCSQYGTVINIISLYFHARG